MYVYVYEFTSKNEKIIKKCKANSQSQATCLFFLSNHIIYGKKDRELLLTITQNNMK